MPQAILRIIAYRYPLGNKALYEYLYGKNGRLKQNSLSATLSRMKKKGLLKLEKNKWAITSEGKELLRSRNFDLKRFFPTKKPGPGKILKNLIVMFDIPEKKKGVREILQKKFKSILNKITKHNSRKIPIIIL